MSIQKAQNEITRSESTRLYLAGNNKLMTTERLGDNDALMLFRALQNDLYIKSVDLRYNNITDSGASFIANLIEETASLSDLNIMCNEITEDGASVIAQALQKNSTVKSLRLNGNKIGNPGGMAFAQMLQVNATLEALDVADADLTTESVVAFATVLHNNTTLKSLNISRPILFTHQEETTVHFANMLKVNKTLTELHLQKYDIRDFGAARLAENLVENNTLTHLDLSWYRFVQLSYVGSPLFKFHLSNRITRDGAAELAKLLKKDTALQVLDLGYNRLEDDGALHLAEALATMNTNLKILVVTNNNIHGKGLCALADAMRLNSSLEQIYIWGNKLQESACIAFSKLLESGRLRPEHTDVQPYVVDGHTFLSELSHGICRWYYWGPSYGDQAQHDTRPYKTMIKT